MSDHTVVSRRAFLTVFGVGVSAVAGCSDLSLPSSDDNDGASRWPSYGANARNTGHVEDISPPENLRSGWTFGTTLNAVAPLALGDDTVYTRIGKRLYAFDAIDGSVRWMTETNADGGGPIFADDTVYVGVRYGLAAYAAADGTEQWRIKKDGPVFSVPMVVDDTVYFGSSLPGGAVAIGLNGEQRWWFDSKGGFVNGPTVFDDTVYYSSFVNTPFGKREPGPWFVYAINAGDGTKRWRFRQPSGAASLPAVDDGSVYVGSTDGHLYALDRANGDLRWTVEVPLSDDSPPVIVGKTVYVGSTDGHVYAFDARDGSREWRIALDAPVSQGIAVSEASEFIYAGTDAGTLFVLSNRSVADRVPLRAPIGTPPAVSSEYVIVGTQDGRVHSLASKGDQTATGTKTEPRSPQHQRE